MREKAHILFLTDVLYVTTGGAEGALWKMTRMLPGAGFRCSIATFASFPDRVPREQFPCPVHLLPLRRTYDWNAAGVAMRLGRLIRTESVSIVHTFFPAADLLGGAVARLSGCPVLVSSRRDMGFQRTALQRFAYRIAAPWFDQVQTVGDRVRERHIAEDGLRPERVVTVRNGVDLEAIDAAPRMACLRELGIEGGGPVVVTVANIRRVKGIDVLVQTAAAVCRQIPTARFLVVGDPQDAKHVREIEAVARDLGLAGQVVFAGRRERVASILKACDVFYLPSRSEGLSNALLEAMACRLPCVATRVGGNVEVVAEGLSGRLVESEDPKAAAERILELLHNPSRGREMGRAGRCVVEERFNVISMITTLTACYEALLSEKRGRNRGAAALTYSCD